MKASQLKEAQDLLWELEKIEMFRKYVAVHSQYALRLSMDTQIPCFVLAGDLSTDILNIIERDARSKLDALGIERDER